MNKVELLDRIHARQSFDCGNQALNSYPRQTARQHIERGISRTFVLVEDDAIPPKPIRGYFTLNICQLKSENLPETFIKKLPRTIAGIKIGRLAVEMRHQGQGLGELLLVAAMKKVMDVFEVAGGIGVFLDAKDENARAYYERFGFVPLPENTLRLFLPLATIKQAIKN